MPNEKHFEDVLAKYPELIEDGLTLVGRQQVLHGRRIDLLFEDKLQRHLLVELKWGPIKDEHIGQLMHYEGTLLSDSNPDLRVMLIGTRVPPNIRRSLDHHGIAWKEIRAADILAFAREKQDGDLESLFQDEGGIGNEAANLRKANRADASVVRQNAIIGQPPALLAVIEPKFLEQAFEEFGNGKERISFGTNAPLHQFVGAPIQRVYFKVKGNPAIVAQAALIEITNVNQPAERLGGYASEVRQFYYRFNELTRLARPIPLSSLRRYGTGTAVRNDVPGACVVEEVRPLHISPH
jgi:hypothetical protein